MGRHQKAHRIKGKLFAATTLAVLSLGGFALAQYALQAPVAAPAVPRPHVQSSVPESAPESPVYATTPAQAIISYPVHPGDSLWKISATLCGSGSDEGKLASANHMSLTSVLPIGKILVISC